MCGIAGWYARGGRVVSEDTLRTIGHNRAWLKNYVIVAGLCRHPKTPPAISMQLVHRLHERDLKDITRDRNVPEGLRVLAIAGKPGASIENAEDGMTLLGLVAMMDPPRAGVGPAIKTCQEAQGQVLNFIPTTCPW